MLRFQGGGEGGGQVCQVVLRILHHVLFSRFSNLEGMYDVCVYVVQISSRHTSHTHTQRCVPGIQYTGSNVGMSFDER